MIWIGVVIAALLTSFWYVRYIRAIGNGEAGRAAIADFCLMFLGSLSIQAWAIQHYSFYVLLLFDAVAALGTYVSMQWVGGKKK